MIHEGISSVVTSIVGDSGSVIDIGGGRFPYYRANYVLDIRKFDEMVGEIASAGTSEDPYFSKKTWISHDFYDMPWPFDDNQFDFSLCMGTLEDLRDPISVAQEIQRISKAGYISTPTRAQESCPYIINRNVREHGLTGYFHHRWFVEIINDDLVFKAKSPLLNNHKEFQIGEQVGQHTLHYFWHSSFDVREEYLGGADESATDLMNFKEKHENWLNKYSEEMLETSLYNRWDYNLGEEPDFALFSGFRNNKIKYYLNVLRNRLPIDL